MSPTNTPPLDARVQSAIRELQELIWQHFPAATFEVLPGQDDPDAIHLIATVDVLDTDEVIDVVNDRLMELQIDDGLPIFVIPVRPAARVRTMLDASPGPHLPQLPLSSTHS